MTVRTIAAALLTSLCLAGCAVQQAAWTHQDPWYNPPPAGSDVEKRAGTPVVWSDVKAGARLEAAALLDRSPVVQLTPEQVAKFVDQPLAGPGEKLFLVRGVYVNWETGHFSVLTDGMDVVVDHLSFARNARPMGRWPLVIALPEKPRNVYVICWVAQ